MNETKTLPKNELMDRQCATCVKKAVVEDEFYCIPFYDFYFQWDNAPSQCPTHEDNPNMWLKVLEQIKKYILKKGKAPFYLNNEIQEVKALCGKYNTKEAHQAYFSDSRRGYGGGGSSEKNSRAGDKQRMKDNRYKPAWGKED